MTGNERVWKASTVRQRNGLPVFMGALLLFVVVIPTVSSKLESLWSSQFTFLVDVVEPACAPAGLCFRFFDGKVERTTSGYRIGVRLEGVDNVYEVVRDIDNGTLKPVLAAGITNTEVPTIRPHYDLYFAFDEVLREVPASLQFKEAPPARIMLAFEHAGGMSEYRTLDFTKADIGKLASLITGLGQAGLVRVGAGLLILLLALTTSLADARACNALSLGPGAFASAMVVRWAALAGRRDRNGRRLSAIRTGDPPALVGDSVAAL
jgi:hypothetical protein